MTPMGGTPDVGLIIAVKLLPAAKTRLSPTFDAAARERLVLAMLTDTLDAARDATAVRSITVVTPDPTAAAVAAERAAPRCWPTSTPPGPPRPAEQRHHRGSSPDHTLDTESGCAARRSTRPAHRGADPRSTRRVRTGEVLSPIVRAAGPPRCSRSGWRCVRPRFGPDSARRHREDGAVELSGEWPGLRCDIDTPADLAYARRLGLGAATSRAVDGAGRTTGYSLANGRGPRRWGMMRR